MTATQASHEETADLDHRSGGRSIGLIVPLENKCLLREVAEALRGLAQVMDTQSRLKGVSEPETLVRVKFEVRHANNLIAAACARHGVDRTETTGDAA